jgi:hypothetical protein
MEETIASNVFRGREGKSNPQREEDGHAQGDNA